RRCAGGGRRPRRTGRGSAGPRSKQGNIMIGIESSSSRPGPASLGRVGVLYGGKSAEREASLMSGTGVHRALLEAGVDAHLFDTGLRGLPELAQAGFDRVFIALHGRWGEDGCIQGALEMLGVPYTGSGVAACALAMDKVMAKRIFLQHGLP